MKNKLVRVSLGLNIVALVPICSALILDVERVHRVFGAATQGRAILLSIYLAIVVMSAFLLAKPDDKMVTTVLAMQVVYKVTTPITVGTFANPVVISNLGIAVLHSITLLAIHNSGQKLGK